MTLPPRHPCLIRLSHALLRRAERSQGERSQGERAASLALDAATLPELHQAATPQELAHLELLLQAWCAPGWVRLKLEPAQPFQTLADRRPKAILLDAAALLTWSGFTPTAPRWSRQLVQALREPGVLAVPDAPALLDYLLRSPLPVLAHRPASDCASVFNALAADCASGQPRYLRELSARHFWGHSKVLDAREELLRLLGAAEGQFLEAPLQLLIDLPELADGGDQGGGGLSCVLFIENGVSFERLAQARQAPWQGAALVYAAGFKGAARRLRQPGGAVLYWRHPAPLSGRQAFEQWLGHPACRPALPVFFYGDLDWAGLQILAQLRQCFATCQAWQPGYAPLLQHLQAGQGHHPDEADKGAQTDPGPTGCAYADEVLLPALREHGRFVDQELWPGGAAAMQPGSPRR